MIKFEHYRLNFIIGYVLKAVAFGKILSDRTVGIFV